uniref:Toxin co-regulated pilus biosynthesis protein Q C-terminal domain-containing protein n=1 Tax=Enterobacter sp. HP19 TaxID=1811975 RepID=A0A2H4UED2_9ENTR|nr:hypothetical protein [Enterobacter sp. HP19]
MSGAYSSPIKNVTSVPAGAVSNKSTEVAKTNLNVADKKIIPQVVSMKPIALEVTNSKTWVANTGSSLNKTLNKWVLDEKCSITQKWNIVWPENIDYPIDVQLSFNGSFYDAITKLFGLYAKAEKPLYLDVYPQPSCVLYVSTTANGKKTGNNMKMKKLSALVAVSILLSGCNIQRINKNVNAANDDIKDVSAGLHKTFETRPAVQFHTEQWINPTPIKISEKELPSKVINCNITYKPGKSVDIYQFGQDVAMLCGVPVRVTPDAAMMLAGGGASTGVNTSQTRQTSTVPHLLFLLTVTV